MKLPSALRRAARRPGVPLAVVAAVAIATAATSALFSIVDGYLFRPLPFPAPDQLVVVDYRSAQGHLPELAYRPELEAARVALRERLEASPLIVGATQVGFATFFEPEQAQEAGLRAEGVDARFFKLFGLSMAIGTAFGSDEERSSALAALDSPDPLPVVISHALWVRMFGGNPEILGVRQMANRRVRIVGVAGRNVKFPGETNVWAPVQSARARPPSYVRLANGVTIAQLAAAFPELQFGLLRKAASPGGAGAIVLLFGAAICLLVVTWVQVIGLFSVSFLEQLREVGVRLCLGASRTQIGVHFAADAALIAVSSFGLAWVVTAPLNAYIVTALPLELTQGQYLTPDGRTFLFGSALSFVGFVLLAASPALFGRSVAPLGLMNGRLGPLPFRVRRIRSALLVLQITLTTALLYVSGLSVRSFLEARTFDYGFDTERVLIFTPPHWAMTSPSVGKKLSGESARRSFDEFAAYKTAVQSAVGAFNQLSQVRGAAVFRYAPLGVGIQANLVPVTEFSGLPRQDVVTRVNFVGARFVEAIGATLIAGHSIDDRVESGREDVAVANEALAQTLAPGTELSGGALGPVVGRWIQAGPARAEIVGIIKNFVDNTPDLRPDPQLFIPDRTGAGAGIAIRVSIPVEAAIPMLQTTARRIWSDQPSGRFHLMSDELRSLLAPYQGQAVLLVLVAGCCLPIAGVGLLGALTRSIAARRREIAIRLAIGATPGDVRRDVLRDALQLVLIGAIAGAACGAIFVLFIGRLFFRVDAIDFTTMLLTTIALVGLGWIVAAIPAQRASVIHPAQALRQE